MSGFREGLEGIVKSTYLYICVGFLQLFLLIRIVSMSAGLETGSFQRTGSYLLECLGYPYCMYICTNHHQLDPPMIDEFLINPMYLRRAQFNKVSLTL